MAHESPQFSDVLVITDDRTHPEMATAGPAGDPPVELVPGFMIEQLPHHFAERVIAACTPRGENYDPSRQFSQIYSFVRRGPVADHYFTFDPDLLIRTALQLSRLVIPNGHSTNYAARVLEQRVFPFKEGETIAPLHPEDREFAFHSGTGARDWLTNVDAEELARLVRRWLDVREVVPQRVKNSLWWTEWTARTPFIQPAYVNTVSALEALVSTNTRGQRAEFVVRTVRMAADLGVEDVNAQLMDQAYTARSEITHGAFVRMDARAEDTTDLARIQALLRAALARAIDDAGFAAAFTDARTVEERWPVPDQWRAAFGL